MKKFYFLTALLLIVAVMPSLAQTNESIQKNTWYIGAGGNFNSSWIVDQNTYGEPKLNAIFTPGYEGNLNVGVDFSDYLGLKMELGYAFMGQKYNGTQYDSTVSRTIKLNYLLLPVMMKFRTGGKVTKFYLMAGT